MPKGKEGSTLILGGWKADLYLTPEGLYLIDKDSPETPDTALLLYNLYNNTFLKELPPMPTPKDPSMDITLPFIPPNSRVLGKFQSFSDPDKYHYVIQPGEGAIYCTCFGFRAPDNCWHYRAIREIGPGNISEILEVKISDLKKEI